MIRFENVRFVCANLEQVKQVIFDFRKHKIARIEQCKPNKIIVTLGEYNDSRGISKLYAESTEERL